VRNLRCTDRTRIISKNSTSPSSYSNEVLGHKDHISDIPFETDQPIISVDRKMGCGSIRYIYQNGDWWVQFLEVRACGHGKTRKMEDRDERDAPIVDSVK
jgi:hypothetical protein